MDARSTRHGRHLHPDAAAAFRVVVLIAALVAALVGTAGAEPPPAVPAFQPGDISIGEPIALPFGGQPAATPAPESEPPPPGPVPGSGWLGLAVAESTVPGRWRVEEVTPAGPADRAGIAVGDELRAVNGVALASPDDVSQALTAIAVGQDVRVAVARADQVSDVVLRAEARPPIRPTEPRRFAEQSPAAPVPAPAPPATPATERTFASPPTQPSARPPAAVAPAGAEWQAAPSRDPAPPQASRFAPQPALPAPGALPGPADTASPRAAPALPSGPTPSTGRTALGVRTVPIDPDLQARFQLAEPTGAYVIGVVADLPAAKAGVPPGSVIVALGDQPVRSPLELTKLVTSGPLDRPVTVQFVLPGGESKQAAVVLRALDAPLERALTGADDTATAPPPLQPTPVQRRAERPTGDEGAIRAEIRALRARLERLERALTPAPRRGR